MLPAALRHCRQPVEPSPLDCVPADGTDIVDVQKEIRHLNAVQDHVAIVVDVPQQLRSAPGGGKDSIEVTSRVERPARRIWHLTYDGTAVVAQLDPDPHHAMLAHGQRPSALEI